MAKAKQDKKEIYLTGGNLADGSRFEEGQAVPKDLPAEDRKALEKMGVIGSPGEKED